MCPLLGLPVGHVTHQFCCVAGGQAIHRSITASGHGHDQSRTIDQSRVIERLGMRWREAGAGASGFDGMHVLTGGAIGGGGGCVVTMHGPAPMTPATKNCSRGSQAPDSNEKDMTSGTRRWTHQNIGRSTQGGHGQHGARSPMHRCRERGACSTAIGGTAAST